MPGELPQRNERYAGAVGGGGRHRRGGRLQVVDAVEGPMVKAPRRDATPQLGLCPMNGVCWASHTLPKRCAPHTTTWACPVNGVLPNPSHHNALPMNGALRDPSHNLRIGPCPMNGAMRNPSHHNLALPKPIAPYFGQCGIHVAYPHLPPHEDRPLAHRAQGEVLKVARPMRTCCACHASLSQGSAQVEARRQDNHTFTHRVHCCFV